MCIAIPMRVMSTRPGVAECVDRHGTGAEVDLAMVGPVAVGQWLLCFLGTAREILEEQRATEINLALQALEAAMRGDLTAIDAGFPDLVGREPPLPVVKRFRDGP